jgi:hypothetical protein
MPRVAESGAGIPNTARCAACVAIARLCIAAPDPPIGGCDPLQDASKTAAQPLSANRVKSEVIILFPPW